MAKTADRVFTKQAVTPKFVQAIAAFKKPNADKLLFFTKQKLEHTLNCSYVASPQITIDIVELPMQVSNLSLKERINSLKYWVKQPISLCLNKKVMGYLW
jgi:hypothetical protein